jgi:hypothetical protein
MKRLVFSLLAFVLAIPVLHAAATPYGTQAVRISNVTLLTTGSPADLTSVTIGLSRYIVTAVYVESNSAAGTLAAATIDVRTAAAGGGASVLNAATALTGLTAADKAQSVAVAALGNVQTAATLVLRQTVDSANAGVVSLVIVVIPLPETS